MGGRSNFYGPPKRGKSFAAVQLALAVAGEGPTSWFGFPILLHGPVLYLQLDTPRVLWAKQYFEEVMASGVSFLTPHPIYLADREIAPFPFNLMNPVHFSWLRAVCTTHQPVLFILDVLRNVFRGDENNSDIMQDVLDTFVMATSPAAQLLISHPRKPSEAGGREVRDQNRGSGHVAGSVDSILSLTPRLQYVSRSAEGSTPIRRLHNGLWDTDSLSPLLDSFLDNKTFPTQSSRAEALSQKLGKSEEACRSLLRRRELERTDELTEL